jgi:spermidine synthase
MSFLSYIYPEEIYKGSSKFSSEIRVIEDAGRLRLLVNGIEQSGRYIDKILKQALDICKFSSDLNGKKILILGLGGGSLIRTFKSVFPDSSIDVVDIDPVIIKVAKTYFGIEDINRVQIIHSDARQFVVETAKKKQIKYGLIIVDLYIGRSVPDFVWDNTFIQTIRSLVSSHGCVFINVVHDGASLEHVRKLKLILENLFKEVQEIPVDFNTFFLATA